MLYDQRWNTADHDYITTCGMGPCTKVNFAYMSLLACHAIINLNSCTSDTYMLCTFVGT